MPEQKIHAIVFRSGERWIARCLEYDLATQTRRLEDMPAELQRVLTVQIFASLHWGIVPFTGFKPAPKRYWEMYERSQSRVEPIAISAPEPVADWPAIEMETRLAA